MTTKTTKAEAPKAKGASLLPDPKRHQYAVAEERRYWIGVIPSCPVEFIALAGESFPKINERIFPHPNRTGEMTRVPVIGALMKMTKEKLEKMQEQLPRTIIRIIEDGKKDEPGTGENIGDVFRRPRQGQLITIPSDATVKAMQKAGRPFQRYTPQKTDEPAAAYMFAVPCDDPVDGERKETYPLPLSETGLEWVE